MTEKIVTDLERLRLAMERRSVDLKPALCDEIPSRDRIAVARVRLWEMLEHVEYQVFLSEGRDLFGHVLTTTLLGFRINPQLV